MSELHIQRFLRNGGTFAELLERYGIKAKEPLGFKDAEAPIVKEAA